MYFFFFFFFFSSRRRHTRFDCDWSSDVCSSDLKDFVVVDAGMTDFVRPSHYHAHHEIIPLTDGAREEETVSVVGPICESGDFLALDRKLPAVRPGEYLAVLGTGAYGFVMSSTYNARPRPPEVLVDGDRYYLARLRETLEDLLRGEVLEPTTWYQA